MAAPSETLVEKLVAIAGRPWAEYGRSGRAITPSRLARLLKDVAEPRQVKFPDGKNLNGYRLHQFTDAFERYLPPEGDSNVYLSTNADEMGTFEPFQRSTAEPEVEVRKFKKSNNDGLGRQVDVAKGGNGTNVCAQCKGTPDGAERLCLVDGAEVWLHRECERFYRESWR
jgi:hypothetical protein